MKWTKARIAICGLLFFSMASAVAKPIDIGAVKACLEAKPAPTPTPTPPGPPPPPQAPPAFHQVTSGDLPSDCREGTLAVLVQALKNQIANCKANPEKGTPTVIKFGCRTYTRQEWCLQANTRMLELATAKDATFDSFAESAKNEFDWYKSDGDVKFTGYDAPAPLDGTPAAASGDSSEYALYRAPAGLVQASSTVSCGHEDNGDKRKWCMKTAKGYEPVPTREEINAAHALEGKKLEIAYVADPLDISFLMVEGAGSVNLHMNDGKTKQVHINYAGQNGRPRYMLSRILKCAGAPHSAWGSNSGIRRFLGENADVKNQLINLDESYVFFDDDDIGPTGVEHIPLSPMHSFATDRKLIPTGAVSLFNVKRPGGASGACTKTTSFAIAQDVGGAILGAHVDWYMGEGEDAEKLADDMNNPGSVFVAVPKGGGTAIPNCH